MKIGTGRRKRKEQKPKEETTYLLLFSLVDQTREKIMF